MKLNSYVSHDGTRLKTGALDQGVPMWHVKFKKFKCTSVEF